MLQKVFSIKHWHTKAIISLFLLLHSFCSNISAHNIQLLQGDSETKLVAETEIYSPQSLSFIYFESTINNNKFTSAYLQICHDHKWWEAPLMLHAEFRGYISTETTFNNNYLAGLTWEALKHKNGFISVEALFRYDYKCNWQTTAIYGYNKNRLLLSGYIDIYGPTTVSAFNENKIFYNIHRQFYAGINLEFSKNVRKIGHWYFIPFAIVRINL